MQPSADRSRRDGGFTVIELVVVVVILSFLAFAASSAVVSSFDAAVARSLAPAVPESITLVARMLDLAGLALLLFGAGFWYLVELHEAGRLDRFRLGHFLLLALTYSLFFAVFAVLGSREVDAWIAVAVAAAVSYPLLVLHVATIVSLRFAATSALPLAMLTTGLVVNGVYGGELRAYVYLGMLCLVITLLTLTYPRLARGQEERRALLEQQLTKVVDELAPHAAAARTAVAQARALLALQDPAEHAGLREWLEHRIASVRAVLEAHERMLAHHDAMRSATARSERRMARAAGMQLAGRLLAQLPHAGGTVQAAAASLAEHRRAWDRILPRAGDEEHCLACGQPCTSGAHFCPACGTRCAEARVCRRCDEVLRMPLHLLARTAGEAAPVTHCLGCGEQHAVSARGE